MKHFGGRVVDLALSVLVAALLLAWAWKIIRPLLGVLIAGAIVVGALRYMAHRRRGFW